MENNNPPGVFALDDAASEDILHRIGVSDHFCFTEQYVMAKFLDGMDNCESQFLVMAIFERSSGEFFTNVVNGMFLSIFVILDECTSDDAM